MEDKENIFHKKIFDTITELRIDKLNKGEDIYFSILSGGMRYLITPADKVLVRKVPLNKISRGDIIVYRREISGFTVHRILSICTQGRRIIFTAKADTHKYNDPPVREDQVIGKVVAVKKDKHLLRLDTRSGKTISWLMYFYSSIWFNALLFVLCRRIFRKMLRIKAVLLNRITKKRTA